MRAVPEVLLQGDRTFIDSIPCASEIKAATFDLDPDSAPGPDGFGGWFYRNCWEIIGKDVIAAIQYCWKRCYIPNGLNSNFLVLIPKTQNAKKANQFRPIGLFNFFFKIFTKILTMRISNLLSKIISPQHGAFIKDNSIQEQIVLASEMELFRSSRISIMINGGPAGYFSVERGLIQGDPLSPFIFVIAEDVLSKALSQIVAEKKLLPMVNRNGICPTHIFFADDMFLFCNGDKIM
ncbi:uncharacterized protein LOC113305633 [Papaver somniferum]|uniref:uncharacterized protein LOC113305633 n=1 Tax=Papaver somniferum TaxID=3469 RepID=UPI000E701990|nr:uncharacterized protein LOC113305633 [Papaver somniferum]